MKKTNISLFIGRQLSRLKKGQSYYSMIMYSITAIGVLKIAFPKISIWNFVSFIPIIFIGTIILGYITDKSNIATVEFQKSVEMNHRYLNKADYKNNDFRSLQINVIIECFKAIQKGVEIDSEMFNDKYKDFIEKYKFLNSNKKCLKEKEKKKNN